MIDQSVKEVKLEADNNMTEVTNKVMSLSAIEFIEAVGDMVVAWQMANHFDNENHPTDHILVGVIMATSEVLHV